MIISVVLFVARLGSHFSCIFVSSTRSHGAPYVIGKLTRRSPVSRVLHTAGNVSAVCLTNMNTKKSETHGLWASHSTNTHNLIAIKLGLAGSSFAFVGCHESHGCLSRVRSPIFFYPLALVWKKKWHVWTSRTVRACGSTQPCEDLW